MFQHLAWIQYLPTLFFLSLTVPPLSLPNHSFHPPPFCCGPLSLPPVSKPRLLANSASPLAVASGASAGASTSTVFSSLERTTAAGISSVKTSRAPITTTSEEETPPSLSPQTTPHPPPPPPQTPVMTPSPDQGPCLRLLPLLTPVCSALQSLPDYFFS